MLFRSLPTFLVTALLEIVDAVRVMVPAMIRKCVRIRGKMSGGGV